MNVLIFTSGPRGFAVGEAIKDYGHNLSAYVVPEEFKISSNGSEQANADKVLPIGRSGLSSPNFLKELAKLDFIFVCGFPYRLPMSVVNAPRVATLNFHAGPLPEYRGGSPLSWQIIHGRQEIELSIHKMEEEFDSGDVLMASTFALRHEEGIFDAKQKADELFAKMSVYLTSNFESLQANARKQDESKAVYWHQRAYRDGQIHWFVMSARQVVNLVRALSPDYGGAFGIVDGKTYRVHGAREATERISGVPGRLVTKSGRRFVVCRDGAVELLDYEIDSAHQCSCCRSCS